jgi:hypothetical protein
VTLTATRKLSHHQKTTENRKSPRKRDLLTPGCFFSKASQLTDSKRDEESKLVTLRNSLCNWNAACESQQWRLPQQPHHHPPSKTLDPPSSKDKVS